MIEPVIIIEDTPKGKVIHTFRNKIKIIQNGAQGMIEFDTVPFEPAIKRVPVNGSNGNREEILINPKAMGTTPYAAGNVD